MRMLGTRLKVVSNAKVKDPLKLTDAQMYHLGQENCNKDATRANGAQMDQLADSLERLTPGSPGSRPNPQTESPTTTTQPMQPPENHDPAYHEKAGDEPRPVSVTPVKGKNTEVSQEIEWKATTAQEREPCVSEPSTANTVKPEKRKESDPADEKSNTVLM